VRNRSDATAPVEGKVWWTGGQSLGGAVLERIGIMPALAALLCCPAAVVLSCLPAWKSTQPRSRALETDEGGGLEPAVVGLAVVVRLVNFEAAAGAKVGRKDSSGACSRRSSLGKED
jgi:hypothetical protein